MLGEEGTEQFTVTTSVEPDYVSEQKIHDPFITHKVVTQISWKSCLLGLFAKNNRTLTTRITVRGSHSAERRIMAMDPFEMQSENSEWEKECQERSSGWSASAPLQPGDVWTASIGDGRTIGGIA